MAHVNDHIVLPATHTCVHKRNNHAFLCSSAPNTAFWPIVYHKTWNRFFTRSHCCGH